MPASCDIRIVSNDGETDMIASKPTLLLNKPVGIVSTQPDKRLGQVPAWKLLTKEGFDPELSSPSSSTSSSSLKRDFDHIVSQPWSMNVVGRLDKDSRGLLLMTQDGVLARKVIGTKDVWKKYVVKCHVKPSEQQIKRLNGSMTLDGAKLKPMRVNQVEIAGGGGAALEFKLREGRKHQIRR